MHLSLLLLEVQMTMFANWIASFQRTTISFCIGLSTTWSWSKPPDLQMIDA